MICYKSVHGSHTQARPTKSLGFFTSFLKSKCTVARNGGCPNAQWCAPEDDSHRITPSKPKGKILEYPNLIFLKLHTFGSSVLTLELGKWEEMHGKLSNPLLDLVFFPRLMTLGFDFKVIRHASRNARRYVLNSYLREIHVPKGLALLGRRRRCRKPSRL